jgi:hypothetical protein
MTRRVLRRVVQPTSDRRSDVSDMRYDLSHRQHSIFVVSVVLRGAGHSQDAAMSPFGSRSGRGLLLRLVRTDGNALHGNLRLVIET